MFVSLWCVCVCLCVGCVCVYTYMHVSACLPVFLSVRSCAYLRMFACMSDLSLDVKVGGWMSRDVTVYYRNEYSNNISRQMQVTIVNHPRYL